MTVRSRGRGDTPGGRTLVFPAEVQAGTLSAVCSLADDMLAPARAYRKFVEVVSRETGCGYVALEIVSPGSKVLRTLAVKGGSGGVQRPRVGKSAVAGVLSTGKPLLRASGARGVSSRLMRMLGVQSLVILPLRSGRAVIGILSIGAGRPMLLDRAAERFLLALAGRASLLLDRQRNITLLRSATGGYNSLFHAIMDTVVMLDPRDGTIVGCNRQAAHLTGYTRKELIGMKVSRLCASGNAEHHRAAMRRIRSRGSLAPFGPVELLRKDGKRVPAEITLGRDTVEGRDIILSIVRDLSEQKRAEVKLAASEELLRIIVEGTLDMYFYVHDAKGVFTYLSPSVEKITGFPPDHWKAHYESFLTANPVNEKVRFFTERALREGIPAPVYQCEILHADGRPLLLEISEKPIFKEGRVIGIQGVAQDITEKKRLEEAILESRDSLNRILDQTPVAVMVFDARGNLMDVNGAFIRLVGVTEKEQLVSRFNVFHSAFIRHVGLAETVAAVYRGEIVDVPAITFDPRTARPELLLNGVERTVHVRVFPVIGRNDRLVNVVAMIEDVTEKRRLEEQLIQSQKMESIGLLAGGIAHDFNNILGGILGYASFVKAQVPKEEKIYPHLETIERSALRAAELTSQLLAFARGGKYVVGPIAINDLVQETAELLRGTIEKSVAVKTQLDPSGPVIEADASQMQQVLMNLCVNARDAMPGGGRIVIATERLAQPDEFLRSIPEGRRGIYVCLRISDTGIGIDKAIRGKIFDPFFTTKEKGKGTGLGLATVYGIVKNHGGFINVESEVGAGTSFSVYIPAIEEAAPGPVEVAGQPRGGKETILIVDDEETIRTLVRDILQEIGYVVLTAGDGVEAVEIYEKKREEIDCVILDMTMPGMGGRETFERLRAMNPAVRAILSTGYSQDERAREVLALGVKGFVQKPYRIDDLAAAVRKVLDAPA